jgi:hypothetical protein
LIWRVLMLLAGAASCGCSLTFVTPPPAAAAPGTARPHVECTTSNVAPILDSVVTGYEAFRVGFAALGPDSAYRHSPIDRDADLALGLAFGAAFAGSAIYGFVSTARCRRIKQGPPATPHVIGVSQRDTSAPAY